MGRCAIIGSQGRVRGRLFKRENLKVAVGRDSIGEKEAKLIALMCSKSPKGHARWTLRLLENKVVELGIVDRASDSTIGRTLKKHSPAASPAVLGHPAEGQQRFVAAMEDVLAVYTRTHDPDRPLVCVDETSKLDYVSHRKRAQFSFGLLAGGHMRVQAGREIPGLS